MAEVQVRALMALARAKALTFAEPDQQGQDHHGGFPVLAAWFGSKAAIHAASLPADLVDELVEFGLNRRAVEFAGELALAHPLSGRTRAGSPEPKPDMTTTLRVAAEEPEMRARFVLASAQRLTEALGDDTFDPAAKKEERYATAHAAAGRNRRVAAKALDEVNVKSGPWLVWRTAGDDRVEGICRGLAGRIFTAANPPGGLIPGAVHTHCRCHAEGWGGPPLRV